MKTIYFDCSNGISGGMAYEALKGLLLKHEENAVADVGKLDFHGSGSCGHFHASYSDIKNIINNSGISKRAKEKALAIYSVIAEAEAQVHGTTVAEVHFHEVGRIEAVRNIVGAAACVDALSADKILCSEICDGKGFIECSHGVIPVPVPAVMAMRGMCDLKFTVDESVKTEIVTPSGLAILIGLGALYSRETPEGGTLRKAVVFGDRDTGKSGGFSAYLLDR